MLKFGCIISKKKKISDWIFIRIFFLLMFFLSNPFYVSGNFKSYHFEVIQNRLILKVEIKGNTFNFAFDTGGDISIIVSVSAKNLGISAKELGFGFTPKKSVPVLGGRLNGFITDDSTFNIVPKMNWMIASLNYNIDSANLRVHGIIGASKIIISIW